MAHIFISRWTQPTEVTRWPNGDMNWLYIENQKLIFPPPFCFPKSHIFTSEFSKCYICSKTFFHRIFNALLVIFLVFAPSKPKPVRRAVQYENNTCVLQYMYVKIFSFVKFDSLLFEEELLLLGHRNAYSWVSVTWLFPVTVPTVRTFILFWRDNSKKRNS